MFRNLISIAAVGALLFALICTAGYFHAKDHLEELKWKQRIENVL